MSMYSKMYFFRKFLIFKKFLEFYSKCTVAMRRSVLRPAEICGPHNIDLSPQPERRCFYYIIIFTQNVILFTLNLLCFYYIFTAILIVDFTSGTTAAAGT